MTGDIKKGFFIDEKALPLEVWKYFFYIARANNCEPVEYMRKLILQEVKNHRQCNLPLTERIVKTAMSEGEKIIKRLIQY